MANNAQIEKALKDAAKIGKQAAVRALNDSAFNTRKHLQEQMQTKFDRPTKFIQNSILYKKANVADEKPTAKVYVANEPIGKGANPTNIMTPEILGGYRKYKRFEKALRYKNLLPAKMYAMPGRDAKLDQYGNISGAWIVRILSTLQAFNETGYLANETVRSRLAKKKALDLFVIREYKQGELEPGIYQRQKNKVKQLIKFIRTPKYSERFQMYKLASEFFDKDLIKQINYQLSKRGGSAGPSSDEF